MTYEEAKGATAAFKAVEEIVKMSDEQRLYLFDSTDLSIILRRYSAECILNIVKHKEELLSQRVKPGDVLKTKDGNKIVVLWVAKDQKHFDGVWDDGPQRGRTIMYETASELGAKKDIECKHMDCYWFDFT
jgi:hypothetical protein